MLTPSDITRRRLLRIAAGAAGLASLTTVRGPSLARAQATPPATSSDNLPADESLGSLELVAEFSGPMPTGVTVSHQGRVFVNFPKWGDDVAFTVGELKNGQAVAYPNQAINQTDPNNLAGTLDSVQSVVVDPSDRLWIVDTGRPLFNPPQPGGQKLVAVDLATDQVVQTIVLPPDVALPTTYLNDVRFDLRRGEAGVAFITDSSDTGPNGIIVVDLASGESWRRLHDHPSTKPEDLATFLPVVEGRPFLDPQPDGSLKPGSAMGSDGIAISADSSRLYYCPLGSRQLYSVATDLLLDRTADDEAVAASVLDEGNKGGGADGLESDADGRVYATNYEHNAVLRLRTDGRWETVVHDPRLLWPDTLSVASNGYLYVTANQLHRQARYQQGQDLRRRPFSLFRVRIDAGPVLLV